MVRVSWGGEVVIADLSFPSENENNSRVPENESPLSPQIPLSPTPPPTCSNTPNTATSPSSYSSPSTASPQASNLNSGVFPSGSSTSSRSNSKVEDSLLEELKSELLFLRGNSPQKTNTDMLMFKNLRLKRNVDDDNNNSSTTGSKHNSEDDIESVSSVESLLDAVNDESLSCGRHHRRTSTPCVKISSSKAEENILSRMFATLSDCEDIDAIDGVDCDSEDERMEQEKELLEDKWRQLFDKFDFEGFGEIPWPEFRNALNHPDFIAEVDIHKREQLAVKAVSTPTSAITFQDFVNVMTGKRTRSFKCAVHQRDREICSENDFHLLVKETPLFNRMVRLIADEFLTEERDRKYYADHYRCWPPPIFIIAVTLLQLSVFCYYTAITGEMEWGGPVPLDSPFIYRPDKRQHVWRFLFYAFLHAGWVHLAFNLLVQLLIGLPLEMVHGSARIGTVYIAGVLAGSLGTSVFDSEVFLVGASGGVYALLAAHLANVLINYNNMQFGVLRLVGVLFVASADVGYAIYDRYAHVSMGLPVSYVAHLTGALAGLTLGLVVLKNFEQRLHEQLLWWVSLGIFAACTIFAMLFNIFHPYPYQGVAQSMFI